MTKIQGTNLEIAHEMNLSAILNILMQKKNCSRIEIANTSGLNKATVTNLTAELIQWGLIRETGALEGKQGKRAIGLELAGEKYVIVSIRLARDFFSINLVDFTGQITYTYVEELLPTMEPRIIFERIKTHVQGIVNRKEEFRIMAIGMGVPGPIQYNEGRILQISDFPGWNAIRIAEEMRETFLFPFFFEHDANAGALAEWETRYHKENIHVMVYIVATQGIGSGVVVDGNIMHGATGFFGEIGHASIDYNGRLCDCGNRGCLTQYASSRSLLQRTQELLVEYNEMECFLRKRKEIRVADILEGLSANDFICQRAFTEITEYLGIGIVNVINSYNPDVIVIGDELAASGEFLLRIVQRVLTQRLSSTILQDIRIELGKLQEDETVLGTAQIAMKELMKHPMRYFQPQLH